MKSGENDEISELAGPNDAKGGSLEGITPEYAFALGIEWQFFRQQLPTGKPFKVICLPENKNRFVALAQKHKRVIQDRHSKWVGWLELWVGDLVSYQPLKPESK
jgi:hypothetical protein